jgi:hypothetical protein
MAEEDPRSIFFGRTYSEFEFSQAVYNYYIHPQWDEFGSKTLYLKILFADYDAKFAIIEMIGEWNDAIENDIMELKREVLDKLMEEGIYKFIMIAESVFIFHSGDKDYYEEWYENMCDENGWAVIINMPESTQYDFKKRKLNYLIELIDLPDWRTYKAYHLFRKIDDMLQKRLD